MALPEALDSRLTLPVIAAPMFLVSGPALVIAACRAGVIGSFPTANARSLEELEGWLFAIEEGLAGANTVAPYAANLIVHRSNTRLAEDLGIIVRRKVPLVIASVGSPAPVVEPVHGYGGLVFADIASMRHAEKAVAAGVDGLILLCAGAGGQTGWANPFAFVRAVREIYDGAVVLAGGIGDGVAIRAALALGADLAYLGTRFIATRESMANDRYREMLIESRMDDIVLTPAFTGLPANMLRPSIVAAGLDPEALPARGRIVIDYDINPEAKRWRDIRSAGHSVGAVHSAPDVAALVAELKDEFEQAGV